jgi:hypothetical protein
MGANLIQKGLTVALRDLPGHEGRPSFSTN